MGSVPNEVIEKVLLRLPDLGDLLRFSITCKHWYHYLSSKSFWKSRSLGQNDSFVSQVSFKLVSFKRKRKQVLSRVHARYDHVRCTYEDAGYKRRKLVVFDNSCVHTLTPPNVYSYVREILFKYNALTNRFLVGLVTQMHPFPLIRLVIYRSVTRKWSISEPLMQVLGRKKELCLPESIGRISGMRLAVVNYEKLVLEGRRVLQPNAGVCVWFLQEDEEKELVAYTRKKVHLSSLGIKKNIGNAIQRKNPSVFRSWL